MSHHALPAGDLLNGAVVVSLARDYWDQTWRSRHQVMSRLALDNSVFFVSNPLNVRSSFSALARRAGRRPGRQTVTSNLTAYIPYVPEVGRPKVLRRFLDRVRQHEIAGLVGRSAEKPMVLYLWSPRFESYLDRFPEAIVCYHLFDDLTAYGGLQDRAVEAALRRIFKRADLVFVSSSELMRRYSDFGNVHWAPNGVDYDAFSALTSSSPVPDDVVKIRRPRVGYAGTLRAQIDTDLMLAIAAARRDLSIVLIGDVSHRTAESEVYRALVSQPNVHMLGQKTTAEIPAYLASLDVGILPYRLEGGGQFCYPLKMHEYLAAGLPVVSSALEAVAPFQAVIRVANSADDWARCIDESLADGNPSRLEARRAVAAENSWDSRVRVISSLIADAVAKRGVPRG